MKSNLPVFDPSKIQMSPSKVIQRFENLKQRDGVLSAVRDRAFQKARESWVGAVFSLLYSTLTSQRYWILEVEEKQEPPDLIIYSYRDPSDLGEIGVVREQILLEVCEYPKNVKFGLVDHLMNKLANKSYHPETWLLCYIRRPGEAMKLIDVIKGLIDLNICVKEIWLLFTVEGEVEGQHRIARVYSRGMSQKETPIVVNSNYLELMKAPQAEFLNASRGLDKKVLITKGNMAIIPLPKKRKK